jgi:hypothetical protein
VGTPVEQLSTEQLYGHALVSMVVLLVQQLQGMSPQQRAAFLHSPAGSSVLQVLSALGSLQTGDPSAEGTAVRMLVSGDLSKCAAADPTQQQQQQQPCDIKSYVASSRELVELLLLPGLLLQPVVPAGAVQPDPPAGADIRSSSSSSSSNADRKGKCPAAPGASPQDGLVMECGTGACVYEPCAALRVLCILLHSVGGAVYSVHPLLLQYAVLFVAEHEHAARHQIVCLCLTSGLADKNSRARACT